MISLMQNLKKKKKKSQTYRKGDNERKNAREKAFHVTSFCFLIERLVCCPYPAIVNFQLLMKTWWLENKIPS